MKLKNVLLSFMLLIGVSTACTAKQPAQVKLDVQQAVEKMNKSKKFIIVDVRTAKEYYDGHVENAVLMPMQEMDTMAEKILPNKKQTIFLYCRTGRRSNIVAQKLIESGYKSVYDIGGVMDKGFTDAFKIVK
ncbi:MAG: rhodanese-like domain-containing protein [Bacteroidales bacterium]|jgi:rhodanese-related sulfurtransferase|nr:rhodanese-like domain-containing protein [Bacteroidales bacterium]MBP5134396.1 rhodanese-like domain-containing protein [Paludibacteraceae bacterium]MBR6309880.1 rhodanese-like domain-containing protein [Paludibacteraceae bacterium]MDD6357652.1 rhodanese-like domain-containing protein [Bacteroidales bacterium]